MSLHETKLSELNLTTKLLTNLIFSEASIGLLVSSGLLNAYIDDFGHRAKYKNCIYFVFNVKSIYYESLEKKITNFVAFHDWYDVNDSTRVLVFKVGTAYAQDLENFRNNIFDDFSSQALSRLPIVNFNFNLDYSKEIYRYNLCEN